jgi:integrase
MGKAYSLCTARGFFNITGVTCDCNQRNAPGGPALDSLRLARGRAQSGRPVISLLLHMKTCEHRLACPRNDHDIAFANSRGGIEHRNTIVEHGLWPAQIAAGVVDGDGAAKYKGLHALRHFYASWCINRRVDGGLELPLKTVQARLGHASIQMTADTYGHLFPRGDDGAEMAAAEKAFLG